VTCCFPAPTRDFSGRFFSQVESKSQGQEDFQRSKTKKQQQLFLVFHDFFKPLRLLFPTMAAKVNLAIICGVSAVWVQRGRPSLTWGAIAGISALFGLSTIVTMVKASASG
jgi:hypothetical protein